MNNKGYESQLIVCGNEFRAFLKRGGRSPAAIERVFRMVGEYEAFLARSGKSLDTATPDDLYAFVDEIEQAPEKSAKTHLWAIRYYYEFNHNEGLYLWAGELREQRIERVPFALKDFCGVDPDHARRLADAGITHVGQMLKHGATPEARQRLSEQTGVPVESILDFVKLSDLARIQGIKGVRARLYVDAGVDTIEKLSQWAPEEFRQMIVEFVERTGFEGIPTLPAEAVSAVMKAKKLPIIISL